MDLIILCNNYNCFPPDTLNEDNYDDIQDDRSPSIQVAMDTDRATLAVGEETGRSCDEVTTSPVITMYHTQDGHETRLPYQNVMLGM